MNRHANWRWRGIHSIWERAADGADRLPVLLIHGWPGGPIEFRGLDRPLVAAGHDVVVPSLPGFAFSDAPERPLNVAGIASGCAR